MQPDITLPKTPAIQEIIALITQVGTSAPSQTDLKNNIGTINWVRNAIGEYTGTLASGTFGTIGTSIIDGFGCTQTTLVTKNLAYSLPNDYSYSIVFDFYNPETKINLYCFKNSDYTSEDLSTIMASTQFLELKIQKIN